jgi:hypothetical protein
MRQSLVKKVLDWTLLGVTLSYLITGLGISQFRIVESLTFGLLKRNLAFRIHEALLVPFLILLGLHIFYRPIRRMYLKLKRELGHKNSIVA